MELSKEKCGKSLHATLETGEITARKVSVFNSIPTTTSTKACGPWTKNMVKELTGEMKAEN